MPRRARRRHPRPSRRPRLLAAALLAVATVAATAALAGCAQVVGPRLPPLPPAPVPPGLEAFYAQKLAWGPCLPFATSDEQRSAYGDPALQCARMRAPLDYAHPEGRTVDIAVLRSRAADPSQRIGSLVVNPGGPGASGVETAASLSAQVAGDELGQRFDLVGFDPRGTGASTPTVRCMTAQQRDATRAIDDTDPSPAGVARAEGEARDDANACAANTGTDVLATVGTRDVAKDMDVLRAALGDRQLSYLGYSYGTRIGSTYAEQFPGNVRALVLDGAVDPDEDPVTEDVEQGRGFQGAFDAFARDCTTRPACPLGADPAQATARYQQLVRPLIATPLPLPDRRVLSFGDAEQGTIQALYVESYWPELRQGLAELSTGSGATLMGLADQYYDRRPDGTYSPEQDAFTAVRCVDDPRVTDPAQALDEARRYDAAAPFLASGRGPSRARSECAFWPVPTTGAPHIPNVAGLAPTLTVSTTGDPATPYQAGVQLAQALHGSLLTVEGTEHTAVLQGKDCVDDHVIRYLVDGVVPPVGARCAAGT